MKPGQILIHEKRTCDCELEAVGPLESDKFIRYCPTHEAASSLLAVLKAVHSWGHINGKLPRPLCESVEAAIAKSTKTEQ